MNRSRGDFNKDNTIDNDDLNVLLQNWNYNVTDLNNMLEHWNTTIDVEGPPEPEPEPEPQPEPEPEAEPGTLWKFDLMYEFSGINYNDIYDQYTLLNTLSNIITSYLNISQVDIVKYSIYGNNKLFLNWEYYAYEREVNELLFDLGEAIIAEIKKYISIGDITFSYSINANLIFEPEPEVESEPEPEPEVIFIDKLVENSNIQFRIIDNLSDDI